MEELRETLKTTEEVIALVGKDTVFEFQNIIDGVAEFKTVIPFSYDGFDEELKGEYMYYTLGVFLNELEPFFKHDNFDSFLSKHKIFELTIHTLSEDNSVALFHQKYDENK